MSKMTKSLLAASVMAATFASGSALAEVSMNIGATSNYIWRGVSQSGNAAAVSGGIDYGHESGFYAGMWTSSLGGADADTTDTADNSSQGFPETDLYLGFGGEAAGIGYDVGYIMYMYSPAEDSDFSEVYGSASYEMFSAGFALTTGSDTDDEDGTAEAFIEGDQYVWVGAEFPVQEDITIGLTYGSYMFEDDGEADAELDYSHYQLAVTKSAGDFGDVTLAYDATDMDDDEATEGYKEDAGLFSISWTKSF